jgi:hypothetical protein
MEPHQALDKALLILGEETERPTVNYVYVGEEWPKALAWQEDDYLNAGFTPATAGPEALQSMRRAHQREVEENPRLWQFESENFKLLVLLLNQVPDEKKPLFLDQFFATALEQSHFSKADRVSKAHHWGGFNSGLALLAEFGVRTNRSLLLFNRLNGVTKPSTGLVIFLRQLAEIIALNFTIFSEEEIAELPLKLDVARKMAARQSNWYATQENGDPPTGNPDYDPDSAADAQWTVETIDAIAKQCEQAQFFYLKGALQETANLEVETDKTKVLAFLDALGFESHLQSALLKAEALYSNATDIFALKNCLGLLRSFLEELHADAAKAIADAHPALAPPIGWGPTLGFLRKNGHLSEQEEKLVAGLYAVISDQGVHPLIAEREYGRLIRNMVIEYGLVFLSVLNKKGVSIKGSIAQATTGTPP